MSVQRLGFPVALLVLAAVLGWMARYYVVSSTPAPPTPDNRSDVSVFTSDPRATVDLQVYQARNKARETLPGFQWVDFSFFVEAKNGPVWWALALGGHAAPPSAELPDSGILPMPSDRHDDAGRYAVPVGWTYFYDSLYTEGIDKAPAFVTDVNWPTSEVGENQGATIIFGSHPEGGDFHVNLAAKVRKPLMQDSGEYVTISSPSLGRTTDHRLSDKLRVLKNLSDVDLEIGQSRDAVSLGRHDWYEPKRMQVGLTVFDLVGVRQESGTPPVAPLQTQWEAKNSLKVDAVFSRPAKAAQNQRRIFFAGVLVSLAGGFLVWAAELLVGPRREPVVALQRRPRKSDPDEPRR